MKIPGIRIKDLAIYVSDYLRKRGIDTVLSGGACVSIYTAQKDLSYDLDFVLISFVPRKDIKTALDEIGFKEMGRHFVHKDTPYFIEFLSPPPSVGDEPVREIVEIKKRKMVLKLLSPTDCVKDRLAAYYHWDDRPSLDQAILVCQSQPVDLSEVQRWSAKEGMDKKYKIFRKTLSAKEGTRR
jgi:hypothetical protein